MRKLLRLVIHDYDWVHMALGVIGNAAFVVGSVFFLPSFAALKTLGVWLFIVGSALMLIGGVGQLMIRLELPRERPERARSPSRRPAESR